MTALSNHKLRVGVIGLRKGLAHARGLAADPQVDLVAVCDMDRSRLQSVAAELGVGNSFTDADALLDSGSLDAVTIATPNDTHRALVLHALDAGLHVLCEKPLALNGAEARELTAAATRAKRTLMVNYSYRYTPASQALADQVRSGALGDIYFGRSIWHRRWQIPAGWFQDKARSGGGPLIDLGVHRLDLALWFMGFPQAVSVSAATYDRLAQAGVADGRLDSYSVEDLATAFIRFENGTTLVLEASWALHQPRQELMETWLYGTDGGLRQYNVEDGYEFAGQLFTRGAGGANLTSDVVPGPRHSITAYQEFVAVVTGEVIATQRLEDTVAVMDLLDAIYHSAAAGAEIRLASASAGA
jgi:predicted dehydrogenase